MSTVNRQWGNYQVLFKTEGYQCKILVLDVGKSISLQYHHHRSEHWLITKGTAEIICRPDRDHESKPYILYEGQSVDIPQTYVHKLMNVGKVPLEIVEVQLGSYLEEDDIVRIET